MTTEEGDTGLTLISHEIVRLANAAHDDPAIAVRNIPAIRTIMDAVHELEAIALEGKDERAA